MNAQKSPSDRSEHISEYCTDMLLSFYAPFFILNCLVHLSCAQNGSTGISSTWTSSDSDSFSPPKNDTAGRTTTTPIPTVTTTDIPQRFEKHVRTFFKNGIKMILPNLIRFGEGNALSPKCTRSFLKLMSDLTKAKVWAVKMLDSTGKIPAGLMEGTFSEYGAFDQCLDIVLPLRNGSEDFRGQYCAVEMTPVLPPAPRNFSVSAQERANPLDTMGTELKRTMGSFYHLKFHFGVCIPSSCSIDDLQSITKRVLNSSLLDHQVPKCYVKEGLKFEPIHIAVLCVLLALLSLAVAGTIVNRLSFKAHPFEKMTGVSHFLQAFCIATNFKKLMSTSSSPGGLKSLHGIRLLSMAWVMLGHTYVWMGYKLSRRPENIRLYFSMFEFNAILNGWLSVEPFFFLSGLLTSYWVLQLMEKTRGRINVPIFIIRRYLRLTPPLLLTMGLLFFLPIISSGPFWYDIVDPELKNCRVSWWKNLLYINNWNSISEICLHPTWYLSTEFQLHILSLLILYPLHRSPLLGLSVLIIAVAACSALVGAFTYIWELSPAILISTGSNQMIQDAIDLVHIRTFTHVGPYCVGMATGYLLLRMRKEEFQFSKRALWLGWFVSIVLSLSSVYGTHRWNTGHFHGPLVTSLYAALHRTAFVVGVAWVAIVCICGQGGSFLKSRLFQHAFSLYSVFYGTRIVLCNWCATLGLILFMDFKKQGPVDWILSSKVLMPLSRLTFMVYLLHGPVMWTKVGSRRTATFVSHYNQVYEYFGHLVTSFALAVPCHLLVEAPIGNLERLMFSRGRSPDIPKTENLPNGLTNATYSAEDPRLESPIQLTSVKNVITDVPKLRALKQNGFDRI